MINWRKIFLPLLFVFDEVSPLLEIGSGNIPEKYKKITEELYSLRVPSKFSNIDEKIIAEKFDYERHKVVTKDGYILSLHHIVHKTTPPCKPPVLFMSGLFGSSPNWISRGRKYDLPYLLTDDGYDVWLGDQRGNRYSTEHVSISPTDVQFWNFSYHEVGMFDVPAMVDYILDRSVFPKLNYIGISMGGTVFFVMCSELPSYNNKIESAALFAPVTGKPSLKLLDVMFNISSVGIGRSLVNLPIINIFPRHTFFDQIWKVMCSESLLKLCSTVTGIRPENLGKDSIYSVLSTYPAGSSLKTIVHLGQNFNLDRFQKFDLGRRRNMDHYGRPDPPQYNMSLVTAPVALYYATKDIFITRKAIKWTSNNLPNLIRKYVVPDPHFGHFDFIVGNNNVALVYDNVMELFNGINPSSCSLKEN